MEREELVKSIAKKLSIEEQKAEIAINEVIAELASPFVFRRPGEEVGLLDNSCTNNCKPTSLELTSPGVRK